MKVTQPVQQKLASSSQIGVKKLLEHAIPLQSVIYDDWKQGARVFLAYIAGFPAPLVVMVQYIS